MTGQVGAVRRRGGRAFSVRSRTVCVSSGPDGVREAI
jgi:hypothetical protein